MINRRLGAEALDDLETGELPHVRSATKRERK